MENSPFSGFRVAQQAADSLRHLLTETKWRKLQKHFSISLCFSCCRCELLLFDLDLLYDHFSIVHQVDLSYIKSLLKETEEGSVETQSNTFRLSENLIEDLIQLSKSTNTKESAEEDNSDNIATDGENIQANEDGIQGKASKPDTPKRKGRPGKRSFKGKTNKDNNVKENITQDQTIPVSKRTRKGGKKDMNDASKGENEASIQNVKSSPKFHRTRSGSKNKNMTENKEKVSEKIPDELVYDEEYIPVDLSELVNEAVDVITPRMEQTKQSTKRTAGRNIDSEEIKAKTCAICKEIQPSIKDCFKHYELVHDYIPKSVYEKPPVDTKFEKSKARNDKRSKGKGHSYPACACTIVSKIRNSIICGIHAVATDI